MLFVDQRGSEVGKHLLRINSMNLYDPSRILPRCVNKKGNLIPTNFIIEMRSDLLLTYRLSLPAWRKKTLRSSPGSDIHERVVVERGTLRYRKPATVGGSFIFDGTINAKRASKWIS